jgi:hypothetical protein
MSRSETLALQTTPPDDGQATYNDERRSPSIRRRDAECKRAYKVLVITPRQVQHRAQDLARFDDHFIETEIVTSQSTSVWVRRRHKNIHGSYANQSIIPG